MTTNEAMETQEEPTQAGLIKETVMNLIFRTITMEVPIAQVMHQEPRVQEVVAMVAHQEV